MPNIYIVPLCALLLISTGGVAPANDTSSVDLLPCLCQQLSDMSCSVGGQLYSGMLVCVPSALGEGLEEKGGTLFWRGEGRVRWVGSGREGERVKGGRVALVLKL